MIHWNPAASEPSPIMKMKLHQLFAVLAILSAGNSGLGQEKPAVAGPESQVFATRGTTDLKVYVFSGA